MAFLQGMGNRQNVDGVRQRPQYRLFRLNPPDPEILCLRNRVHGRGGIEMRRDHGCVGIRKAFTVIELLVIVAVIAVLVGLLLPAMEHAREAARCAYCMNSMKGIGLSFHMFVDERDGYFPATFGMAVCDPRYGAPQGWRKPLEHYGVVDKQLHCPSDRTQGVVTSYVYNEMFAFGRLLSKVKRSSEKIMFSERGDDAGIAGASSYPAWLGASDWRHYVHGRRHRGRSNYLYTDGHVSSKTFDETIGEENGDDHRNDTNQHYIEPFFPVMLFDSDQVGKAGLVRGRKRIPVGDYDISLDGEDLAVTCMLDEGWEFTNTHLYCAAEDPNVDDHGDPSAPGQFPYHLVPDPPAPTVTYRVPWREVAAPTLFFSFHGDIVYSGGGSSGCWSAGDEFGEEAENWAMYVEIPIYSGPGDGDGGDDEPDVTWMLTVTSWKAPDVQITGTPAGVTDYVAEMLDTTEAALTAPATVVDGKKTYGFQHWELDGVEQAGGEQTLSFPISADTTATAVYKKQK